MDFEKARQLANKEGANFVGHATGKCPRTKSCLIVLVYKDDTKEVLPGAQVQISGLSQSKKGEQQIFLSKNTDGNGIAKFAPWDPGSYTAQVTLTKQDGYEAPESVQQSVTLGDCPVCVIPVKPLPKLRVKVVQKGDHLRVFNDAVVKLVSGPQKHPDGKTKAGVVDYGKTKSGKYEVRVVSLKEDDRKEFVLPKRSVTEELGSGEDKTIIIEVEKLNVVTPKIELEYKVVLLAGGLQAYQELGEEKIYPDPTYIQLSFRQTGNSFNEGGKVKFSPANVEVYADEECKKKFPGNPATGLDVKPEQISGLTGLKLYLRGKTAGKFTVFFELNDPRKDSILLETNPAEEEMSAVELMLRVHRHDEAKLTPIRVDPDTDPVDSYYTDLKNKALPDQVEMKGVHKAKRGRLLHVQKDKNFDRAKAVIEIFSDEWPADAAEYKVDDYEIVINETNTSGAVEIFDQEWDGTLQPFPLKIKVKDLKAGKREYWVQGKDASRKLRDVRLDLGMDRQLTEHHGLDKTPKRNGDWARFSVVQIAEVKVEYTPEAGKAIAWDKDEKRFYINLKPDNATHDGRKIIIGARLSEKLEGVTIHFMLTPDRNNLKRANWNVDFPAYWKWKDIPAALKHKDKEDRKNLLHLSAETDEEGYAKIELLLSRIGGDKFHPTTYIDQDPHLAKYVHAHPDLGLRKPVFSKDGPIQVWRKVWYQVTRPSATIMPAADGFVASQRRVFIEPVLTEEKQMTAANFTVDPIRASWQFNTDGSDTSKLCIGTHNVDDAMALFTPPTADTNPKFHVILCDEQYDAKNVVTKAKKVVFTNLDQGPKTVKLKITGKETSKVTINDPPLVGGPLIVSANWKAQANESGTWIDKHQGTLPAANIEIENSRGSKREIKVTRPATCPGSAGGCLCNGPPAELNLVNTAIFEKVKEWFVGLFQSPQPVERTRIELTLQLKAADGKYNGWAPNNSVADVVAGGRPDYAIHNTMGHEMGHLYGKVRWNQTNGLPNHPKMYQKRGGMGTHCANNATFSPATAGEPPLNPAVNGSLDAQGQGAGQWRNGDCIIFGYSRDFKREWCEHCAFDWLVSDLSKFGR
jgi:hypothetical protein